MKFSLWTQYGALNSAPVFDALKQGLENLGHDVVENDIDADVAVIWSVLWSGRMAGNRRVYYHCAAKNKPVLIIEVGSLIRNHTWKLSLDNVNGLGYFGELDELDLERPSKLGLELKPYNENTRREILITTQRPESLQWTDQPDIEDWVQNIVNQLKKFTDRNIVVRPHPRYSFKKPISNIIVERPVKIEGTYDDFNLKFNYHCIVYHNSGIGTQSLLNGCPIICHESSLAFPLSNKIENIENLEYFDRSSWLEKISHTEWAVEEISKGIPLQRLIPEIESRLG